MSRTDAHAPYWTWCEWYEPSHSLHCVNQRVGGWRKNVPCDLPERAVRHAGRRTRGTVGLCTWEPVWPNWREARWLVWKRHTPRWFIHHVWTGAERVRSRDKLKQFCKEYNATGGVEDGDFPNYQARNCARWLWD